MLLKKLVIYKSKRIYRDWYAGEVFKDLDTTVYDAPIFHFLLIGLLTIQIHSFPLSKYLL